ncbi:MULTISPECIES: ABC transporter permease [Bacillaceae]|uniref:ABC transporter permease n=1 Tax=Bacillaceae TaxID=186817 RepID=UPI000588F61F|nr:MULTISPECIES: ABC transporter permease [Bacillus]KKB42073.1 permease [Bacillus thermotolerans]MEC1903534.1 ABC transporter permease [Bacillus atrophaeus]MEC2399269.1 ABC transporter permease [Bacillus atrophaeus]MED4436846.1 ABC transporter permease [Bacillus atrophaeus]MED4564026.1 ABC transporter permease [Bacillus atrophaeus]
MKNILSADKLKLKRSSLLIIVLLVPLLILAYELVNLTYRSGFVEKQVEMFGAGSMWMYVLYDNSLLFGLGFPLAVTLAASVIANIEHQANGWKQTLSMPISRGKIYLSKFIWLTISLFLSTTIFLIGMVLLGKVLAFEGEIPWGLLIGDCYGMLITVLPIMAFQFWLSMTIKNQAFSILIGSVSAIMGLFLAAAQTTRWFPLAYPIQSSTVILQYEGIGTNPDFSAYLVINLILGLILMFIGSKHFAKRNVQ